MIPKYRIAYTLRAKSDLLNIYSHIAQDSPDSAEGMLERILYSVELLSHFPRRQKACRSGGQLKGDVFSLPIWPYVVFFRISEDEATVHIVHIRHGARRPLKRF